jgi:hypothetical protein
VTSSNKINTSFTLSDYIVSSSQSPSSLIFAQPFKRGFNQPFSSKTYIAFCRFFLGLPPPITVGNAVSTSSADYPLQPCLEHVGHYLDANACHASACTAAYKARNIKHNNIVRVLSAAATEAGLEATREPDTHTLLLAEFSKEDCRRIFPKKLNIAYRTAFSNLTVASETFMNPSCTLSSEQKSASQRLLSHH